MSDPRIAVIGPGDPQIDPALEAIAHEIGTRLAEAGVTVVCGGLAGVMAAAARGSCERGGAVVGYLPGHDPAAANRWITEVVATGLGEGRNLLVVREAAAVIAIGGGYGTLSEIGFALKLGRPVVGVATWELRHPAGAPDPIMRARDAAESVRLAIQAARFG